MPERVSLAWLKEERRRLVADIGKRKPPPTRQELSDLANLQGAIVAFENA